MDLIELILWIVVAIIIIVGVRWSYLFLVKRPKLSDIRGMLTEMLRFSRAPTVPTIRIVSRYGIAALELGRRARIRENSLYDSYDKKGGTSPANQHRSKQEIILSLGISPTRPDAPWRSSPI